MSNTPAFPTSNWTQMAPYSNGYNEGMTLRDYFAAKAMAALLLNNKPEETDEPLLFWARDAYLMADAMMEARWE
jgi:hypothetical protein